MPPGKEAAVVFVDGTPTEPTEEDVELYRQTPEFVDWNIDTAALKSLAATPSEA